MERTLGRKLTTLILALTLPCALSWPAANLHAQSKPSPSAADSPAEPPETVLAGALAAACRQDSLPFSDFLTADNSAAFQALPSEQRTALMKRFVLLDDPGKALLTTSLGRPVVRCESAGFTTEMYLGETRLRDNLAFIPLRIPVPDDAPREITFGLVREHGNWKLLSLGVILLDIPALAQEWSQADLQAHEQSAVNDLHQLAAALNTYRSAYGRLPESLATLGPAKAGEISPDNAGLIDADLAAGAKDGYAFRYSIIPPANVSPEDAGKAAGFALAGTPDPYGKAGRRSFFLDSGGVLRGADKQGAVATSDDPRIDTP